MQLSINWKSKDKNIGQITLTCSIFFVYNGSIISYYD